MAINEDTDRLVYLLRGMAMVSLRASPEEVVFGPPCSHLIEQSLGNGLISVANHIRNSVREYGTFEYRLNGAGLKLLGYADRHTGTYQLCLTVGGDQRNCYPVTLPRLEELIDKNGFARPI